MKIETRDAARAAIREQGIHHRNVTLEDLESLHQCIDARMKASGNYRGTYRMNPEVGPFMSCQTDQWERREAISFNSDGFIGFAGWADDKNIIPVLEGVQDWLEVMAQKG